MRGHEITYQSWFGVDKNTLASNRRYNPAGEIYDDNGNLEGHYDNQVDNYRQDHYQLHWNQKIDPYTSLSLGFNYTYGRGYYEEYKDLWFEQNINFSSDNNFSFLGLKPVNIGGSTVDTTENIVHKWLDNDYYVATFSLNRQKGNTEWNLGALYSSYVGIILGSLSLPISLQAFRLGIVFTKTKETKKKATFMPKLTIDSMTVFQVIWICNTEV